MGNLLLPDGRDPDRPRQGDGDTASLQAMNRPGAGGV
jgi:hypothetical protein